MTSYRGVYHRTITAESRVSILGTVLLFVDSADALLPTPP
ncbi:hypothetical protein DSUL_100065 [Desulfovibrionales bacterium]